MNAQQAWSYVQSGEGLGVQVCGRDWLQCFRIDEHTLECDSPDRPEDVCTLDHAEFSETFGRFSFEPVQVQDMA